MSDVEHLSRPPIVEALIDIRIPDLPGSALESIRVAAEELAPQFPERHTLNRFAARFQVGPAAGGSVQTTHDEAYGVILKSADGCWVAQLRLDGMTVSRLAPYRSWDDLRDYTKQLWTTFAAHADGKNATRLATRYVNKIEIPFGKPIDTYFKTTFVVPEAISTGISGYFLRFMVPFEVAGCNAIVTQSLEAGAEGCIFDIDVFSQDTQGFQADLIWSRLELLRELKNRIFFESLTKGAVERYQ